MTHHIIQPGSTLGVLGGGQLGRMFAIAARRLGYRVHVLVPEEDSPTSHVADVDVRASYDDLDAVAGFARAVDVVTFEFENVSAAATETAARHAPVRPAGRVLQITQHRIREKTFLRNAGLPVTPFLPVSSPEQLHDALTQLGTPAVLKTASWGYDGKGQTVIRQPQQAAQAWADLSTDEAILEAFIDFQCEVSVVCARGLDGQIVQYGPMHNTHRHHILDVSVTPAELPPHAADQALAIAGEVMRQLDVVGVLCVEFFVTRAGEVLINELAPRPHNSGHLTIDGHVTCQFEQQVRAVCGLPLGSAAMHAPAAGMANLLGDLWPPTGEPDWSDALKFHDVKLHLYGKTEPRPGRKMGHLAAVGPTPQAVAARLLAAREALARGPVRP